MYTVFLNFIIIVFVLLLGQINMSDCAKTSSYNTHVFVFRFNLATLVRVRMLRGRQRQPRMRP